jgi:hypothetical protein
MFGLNVNDPVDYHLSHCFDSLPTFHVEKQRKRSA